MGESIARSRIERAAKMYRTNQHAEEALGLASGSFGRLCRRYGIPSPGNRRAGVLLPEEPDPTTDEEAPFIFDPNKPRLELRDISERMRGNYVLTQPQLKLLWACYESLPVRSLVRRNTERRLENYAKQHD